MKVEIITAGLDLTLYGFSGAAPNRNYTETAFKLMDRTWQIVKSNQLKNNGQNIWVYEDHHRVFAGLELAITPMPATGLEQKRILLSKYGYYKHVGPYSVIKQAGHWMSEELKSKGFEVTAPYIEIYGHWSADESKLETELLMCLQ